VRLSTTLGRGQRWVALLSVLFCACFEPDPMRCLPCEPGCPTGETCSQGLCQTHAGECTLGANSSLCAEQCCLDGACFELKHDIPTASPALWLDWTSLYEDESTPIWRDRSSNTHSFTKDGSTPQFSQAPQSDTNVLRFSAIKQSLALEGRELFELKDDDFLLLVAGSLECKAARTDAEQCLVARADERKSGLRLCARLDHERPSQIATCAEGEAPATCVSALVSGIPCGRMALFTLRRASAPAADGGITSDMLELRHNAVTQARLEVNATFDLEVDSSLRIGGRAMQSFVGDIALVILIVGTVKARETCELERFLLSRLAAARMPTAGELPDCSVL
jgi:hypothetical protein